MDLGRHGGHAAQFLSIFDRIELARSSYDAVDRATGWGLGKDPVMMRI